MHKNRFSRYVFEIRREKTMKKNLKHMFSAAICAIMLFACVFPNFAAADTELSSVDAEKPEAFFARSAGDGRHNFDHPDYADGQLLSTEREMQLSDGIRVTACFAGDVNEDGAINMADALLIMRCATELGGELPLRLADADRNGSIGIPDALLAARVAMGN